MSLSIVHQAFCVRRRPPPVLRYPGGKYRLAKLLCRYIPPHEVYVEPLCGGASLFFAKRPSKTEVLADIDCNLINFWKTVQRVDSLEDIVKYGWEPSRERFEELKRCVKENVCELEDPTFKAYAFLYVNKFSYAGMLGRIGYNPAQARGCKVELCHIKNVYRRFHEVKNRISKAILECADFRDTIRKWDGPNTFFYLDPPYWTERGSEYFTGYVTPREVLDVVRNVQGKWLLTYNDHPLVRKVFEGFIVEEAESRLEMGKVVRPRRMTHLIIRNYRLPWEHRHIATHVMV